MLFRKCIAVFFQNMLGEVALTKLPMMQISKKLIS